MLHPLPDVGPRPRRQPARAGLDRLPRPAARRAPTTATRCSSSGPASSGSPRWPRSRASSPAARSPCSPATPTRPRPPSACGADHVVRSDAGSAHFEELAAARRGPGRRAARRDVMLMGGFPYVVEAVGRAPVGHRGAAGRRPPGHRPAARGGRRQRGRPDARSGTRRPRWSARSTTPSMPAPRPGWPVAPTGTRSTAPSTSSPPGSSPTTSSSPTSSPLEDYRDAVETAIDRDNAARHQGRLPPVTPGHGGPRRLLTTLGRRAPRGLDPRRPDHPGPERIRPPPAPGPAVVPVDVAAYHVPASRSPPPKRSGPTTEPFPVGGSWGPPWDTTWFRLRGTVPAEWAGRQVALGFGIGNAGLHRIRCRGPGVARRPAGAGPVTQPPRVPAHHRRRRRRGRRALRGGGRQPAVPVRRQPLAAAARPSPTVRPCSPSQRADLHVRDPEFDALLARLPGPRRAADRAPRRRTRTPPGCCAGLERACNLLDLPDISDSWRRAQPVLDELLAERAGARRPTR